MDAGKCSLRKITKAKVCRILRCSSKDLKEVRKTVKG